MSFPLGHPKSQWVYSHPVKLCILTPIYTSGPPRRRVSSLAVQGWNDGRLLAVGGLGDRRPRGRLVHVMVVVMECVVACGRGWRQPDGLVVGGRGGPERAESLCGGVGRRRTRHRHLGWSAGSTAARAFRCPQLGEHSDGIGEVGRRGRSVAWSAHLNTNKNTKKQLSLFDPMLLDNNR